MGFFTLAVGGLGFIFLGAWQAFTFSTPKPNRISLPSSPLTSLQTQSTSKSNPSSSSSSSSFSFLCISVLSFLFILNSLFSFIDALNSRDRVGSALQLQALAIAALFFLYAVVGLLMNSSFSSLPSSLLDVIALFAFVEEFLLFYLQRKDVSGVENRYFDLLLVPITVCVVSTILDLKSPKNSNFPKFTRGVGLILQGMWFVQMGLSFHTKLIAHGCSLHEKSRGNYTVKCKGHPEYHRARAIATLQFNCHLALLVVLVSFMYSVVSSRYGGNGEFMPYRPLVAEMQPFENQSQFTLDSDEEEEEEIREDDNAVSKQKAGIVEHGLNGHHVSHQH